MLVRFVKNTNCLLVSKRNLQALCKAGWSCSSPSFSTTFRSLIVFHSYLCPLLVQRSFFLDCWNGINILSLHLFRFWCCFEMTSGAILPAGLLHAASCLKSHLLPSCGRIILPLMISVSEGEGTFECSMSANHLGLCCGPVNWSFNWWGYACLVYSFTALKNLLSALASSLPALMLLTSLLAVLLTCAGFNRVWRSTEQFSTFAPGDLQQRTCFMKQRKHFQQPEGLDSQFAQIVCFSFGLFRCCLFCVGDG